MTDTEDAGGPRPTTGATRRALTAQTRVALYAARRYLPLEAQKELDLRIPVLVYFKDPAVAAAIKTAALDDDFFVPWEPGLRDGPTSARFVVVDYDATTNVLAPPAIWDKTAGRYLSPTGQVLDESAKELPQFHQVSVWATIQHTLDFFESGFALGRRISWAFEGGRLIVVPHAGYGQNAYYDRASKSLQFYWFEGDKGRVDTCRSSDIVNHEFAHAVLDGLRPFFLESVSRETAAFHEFVGDLTALLMALRNNGFRERILKESNGDLATDTLLASLGREFGEAALGLPYLRSAQNDETMESLAGTLEPHALSQVLTGAMFEIIRQLFAKYRDAQVQRYQANPGGRKPSDLAALWSTIQRMQMMAIQPLDLLPPCEGTFRDYALAVLRSEQVANPTDPDGYRTLMFDVFTRRGILLEADRDGLLAPAPVFKRPDLDVFHPIEAIAASRGSAYRFLDDNRSKLLIPPNADLNITEVVRASKLTSEARALPDQIVVQYVWREDVSLEGERFGRFAGEQTTMLCGATLVLDQNGNLIHWSRKPGSQAAGTSKKALDEQAEGKARLEAFLDILAARIAAGMVGETLGGAFGVLARASPPFGFRREAGALRFELAPHFSTEDDLHDHSTGERQWQISS